MKWKTIAAVTVALFMGLGVLIKLATRLPEPPAHQVFINGNLLTMDADNSIVEAIAIRGDRIEAVGSTEDIMAGVADDTLVTDLRGRTMLPGFIDAHLHIESAMVPPSRVRIVPLM